VYEQLDQNLEPRGPDSLHDLAAEYLVPEAVILDAGCRDSADLIRRRGTNAPASRTLLRIARLRRLRRSLVESHGEEIYNHVEANLHWGFSSSSASCSPPSTC
jgi:hypothetical protein